MNRVTLLGNLGADPEIRTMNDGNKVANLRLATSESWKDKATGERKERVEWHTVTIWTPGLIGVVENYLRKGSKVLIEGQIRTRKWEKDGVERYSTEIVLQGFDSRLVMLDGPGGDRDQSEDRRADRGQGSAPRRMIEMLDDDIPFSAEVR